MEEKGSRCGIATRGNTGPRVTKAACVALVALFACALPAAGSEPQAIAGSATIVIHGQGRVTSEPAGAIDCPGDCSHTFTGSTSLTLRATPTTGWVTAQNASCGETDVCAVALNDFGYTIHVYFRPRAKLQVWPNGEGAIMLSPTPANWLRRARHRAMHSRQRLLRHGLRVLLRARHGGDRHGGGRCAEHLPRLERA